MRNYAIGTTRRVGIGGAMAATMGLALMGCSGAGGKSASAYNDTASLPRAAPAYDGSDVVATPGRSTGPSALELNTSQSTTPTIRQQDNERRGGTSTGGSNAPAPGTGASGSFGASGSNSRNSGSNSSGAGDRSSGSDRNPGGGSSSGAATGR